jgi:hypothetical protein
VEHAIDPVAQRVGLASGQGAVGRAQDNPQQDVVLAWPDAEAFAGWPGQIGVRRRGEERHLLEQVGVRPQGLPEPVAERLRVGSGGNRHGHVAPSRRKVGYRVVRREVEHLGRHARIG